MSALAIERPRYEPRLAVFRDPASIVSLEHDWRRLQEACGGKNPFLSWEWNQGWIETHRQVRPWIVAEYFADRSLAGLAAFEIVQRGPFYSLEPLAQAAGSDEFDVLIHPRADADTPSRLLDVFLHSKGWHVWRLDSVDADGYLGREIEAIANQHHLTGVFESREYLPRLDLPPTLDHLLAQRSANFRSEVRRRRKALERRAGSVRLHIAETPSDVLSAIGILFTLHNRRRSQKKSIGIFEDEATCEFHRLVALRLASRRQARLYLLIAGERPIASLYGFEADRTFLFFQSGFDPSWADASPGTVLMSGVIEDCIQRGLQRFDFLRGDEPYKLRWAPDGRYTKQIRLGRGTWGRLYFRLRSSLKTARDKVLAVQRW